MSSLRRALPLSLFLISLGSCRQEIVEDDAENRLLESLMEDYVTARFDFYPVEATDAGLPGNDDRLGSFARSDIERRIAWLVDFQQKLSGLRPRRLSETANLDALWLSSLSKAEMFDLEERALWRTTASFYGEMIRAGLVSLLLSSDMPTRTGALAGRLDEVPALVAQAEANLADPGARLWIEDGVASIDRCLDVLRELVPSVEKQIPSYRLADVAERSRLAVRSLQALRAVLSRRLEEASDGQPALGEQALARFFLYHEMVDRSLDDIFRDTSDAIEARANTITELALEKFSGEPLSSLLGTSQSPELSQELLRALVQEIARLVSLPTPIEVTFVPAVFLAPEPVRLWREAAIEPVRQIRILVGVPLGSTVEDDVELLTWVELTTRLPQFDAQARSRSLLRRVFAARTTSEGWRSWRWSRSTASEYRGADPVLSLRSHHRALLEELRLRAVLSFHARGASLQETQELFQHQGYLSVEEARREARQAALDPGVGSPALGRDLLKRLSRDFDHEFPLSTGVELDERILEEGLLPIRLIRAKLLDSRGFES